MSVTSPDEKGFALDHGLIKYKGKIWIGSNTTLQTKLISALHDSAIGGHSGIQATYHRVKKLFFWSGLKMAIENFIKQCLACQQAKHTNLKPAGFLQPLPVPQDSWQDLTMDFIEGLPKSKGYDVIMVIVDRLTKYAHFVPLKHPFSAAQMARAFLEQVVRLHGVSCSIVSDRDKIFTSTFWKELFAAVETRLLYSTAYHPQTNGQSERVNQCLEMYLRCAVHDCPHHRKKWIAMAEFWYNSSFHSVLGCSLFKALYGGGSQLWGNAEHCFFSQY